MLCQAMDLGVGRFWILIVAEILMLSSVIFPVASQSPKGFVSIDCGAVGGWDPVTTLDWESDRKYLQAADQLTKEGVTVNANVTLAPSRTPLDNAQRLETALVFLPGNAGSVPRSKYCYAINIEFNSSGQSKNYLLRVTFPSRNLTTTAEGINGEPISFGAYTTRFYCSVDSTYIATVELAENPQTIELIITPLDSKVYVCLIPLEDRSSMPAISAVELRPLAFDMYVRRYQDAVTLNASQGEMTYLMTVYPRLNFGGDPTLPSLRYPGDEYDRLWSAPSIQSTDVKSVVNTSVVNMSNPVRDRPINPPEEVMRTAWEGKSLESNISFTWNLTSPRPQRPARTFACQVLSYDILDASNATRVLDILYDEGVGMQQFYSGWGIDDTLNYVYNWWWIITGDIITFTVRRNSTSQLPVMVNTAEMYGVLNAMTGRTVTDDAEAVGDFALEFPDRLDGTGDPCLSVPWAWIVCSVEVPPRITQVNLTSRGIGGSLPRAFGRLNRLTVLDLSNNSFSGRVPSSLGNIAALRALNLGRNELSGELPIFTSQSLKNLEFLSVSRNRLSGSLFSLISAVDDTLSVLDMSNNSFSGNIPVDIERLANLQNLDLSNNQLSGELKVDILKLTNLQTLDLTNNHIAGTVPDDLWKTSSLAVANLDRNRFTQLNLTTWYKLVMHAKSFEDSSVFPRKVRLVGNQIQNIILPSLPPLETMIASPTSEEEQRRTLQSPAAFILLGDNPWCKDRGGPNTSLVERYLCRVDENESFWSPPSRENGTNKTTVIIVVIICVLVVVVMGCVLAYFLWRMRRRARELHQIQEALAKEHIKPPFFSYEDLKLATHNFSSKSILGRGGFGIVYKADFADGRVLAVKKLNPTEQNTSEFLKEIVNITGIKHKHLIQLKGCCVREKQQRMLVYEYAENKSLAEALWGPDRPFVLSWKQRFNICLGIARGLAYLHDELPATMVHRDIKPQNILLDKDYNAQIADFGLVRTTDTDKHTQITVNIGGTLGYCSPEYLHEGVVSEKLDVYSYGIVLLEIVSGRMCINHKLPEDQVYIRAWAVKLYEEDPEKLLKLVDKELVGEYDKAEVLLILQTALACCQLDAEKRPTMSKVMNILAKQADVATDILSELKTYRAQLQSISEDDMGDRLLAYATDGSHIEERSLISLSSGNSSKLI